MECKKVIIQDERKMLTSLLPLTRVVQEFEEGAPHPRQRSEELTLPEFLPEFVLRTSASRLFIFLIKWSLTRSHSLMQTCVL